MTINLIYTVWELFCGKWLMGCHIGSIETIKENLVLSFKERVTLIQINLLIALLKTFILMILYSSSSKKIQNKEQLFKQL